MAGAGLCSSGVRTPCPVSTRLSEPLQKRHWVLPHEAGACPGPLPSLGEPLRAEEGAGGVSRPLCLHTKRSAEV